MVSRLLSHNKGRLDPPAQPGKAFLAVLAFPVLALAATGISILIQTTLPSTGQRQVVLGPVLAYRSLDHRVHQMAEQSGTVPAHQLLLPDRKMAIFILTLPHTFFMVRVHLEHGRAAVFLSLVPQVQWVPLVQPAPPGQPDPLVRLAQLVQPAQPGRRVPLVQMAIQFFLVAVLQVLRLAPMAIFT
jgi:hypothetical protein